MTCTACSGSQTCGGGGTPGVCGCTPNCYRLCGGVPDGCGGTCNECPACTTCNYNLDVCDPVPDHSPCGTDKVCFGGFCVDCIPGGQETANGVCDQYTIALCCSNTCTQQKGEPFARCCTTDGCCVFDANGKPLC